MTGMPLLASVLAAARPAKPAPAGKGGAIGLWNSGLAPILYWPAPYTLHTQPAIRNPISNLPGPVRCHIRPAGLMSGTQMRSGDSGPTEWAIQRPAHINGCDASSNLKAQFNAVTLDSEAHQRQLSQHEAAMSATAGPCAGV